MLTFMLLLAAFASLFFRSLYGFLLSFLALLLVLYPITTSSILLIGGVAFLIYFRRNRYVHKQPSNRGINTDEH